MQELAVVAKSAEAKIAVVKLTQGSRVANLEFADCGGRVVNAKKLIRLQRLPRLPLYSLVAVWGEESLADLTSCCGVRGRP